MYASDDRYADILAVSMLSLLEHSQNIEELRIFIVDDEISAGNRNELIRLAGIYRRTIDFIKKPNIRKICGTDLMTLRWSDSAYSRLFLSRIFGNPPCIDRVLYLDCDTLILRSLESLWNEDVSDYLGAAVWECMSNLHKYIIGADKNDNYINTGVMIINVRKWISEKIEDIEIDYIKKHRGKTEYVDQGVINGTVSNRFKIISPCYNLTTLAYDFSYQEMQTYRKPEFGYTRVEWETAVECPVIVHFTTSFLSKRPWIKGSMHPYTTVWRYYYSKTKWKKRPYKKASKAIRAELFRLIPREVVIISAGFLHSYMKPIIFKIRSCLSSIMLLRFFG